MNKKVFLHFLKVSGIMLGLSLVMTFSALMHGASVSDNTAASMALAFDKYLKTTDQDYVAAKFYSDDPLDPIRKSEFNQVSVYQSLWQLKKGPDNSLIRVNTPAYSRVREQIVAPITFYPKIDATDDTGAIEPIIYSGYDQDFKGDYLDIDIVKLKDEDKQYTWSDFYRGGKLENYKTDTHSIMLSEKVARKIYAERYSIPVESVTQDNIESLVGTFIRCKVVQENGNTLAPEREEAKPLEERDQEVINHPYYSPNRCSLKKVIGLLDNKSAEKYYPLIGDEFVFINPTSFVSYDYFHPTVYGMFKNNLVGNRTSLLYFLAFGDFAYAHEEYHLCFCEIKDGKLIQDGSLQKNYEKCLEYYKTNAHEIVSGISLSVSLVAIIAMALYLVYLFSRKKQIGHRNLIYLLILFGSLLLPFIGFRAFRYFVFAGFYLPTLSIYGFSTLFIMNVLLVILTLILSRGKKLEMSDKIVKQTSETENNKLLSKKEKVTNIINDVGISALIGLIIFVLFNVVISKSSFNSLGLPSLAGLLGLIIASVHQKLQVIKIRSKLSKQFLLYELTHAILNTAGVVLGVLVGALLGKLGLIWVSGIGFSIPKMAISIVLGCLVCYSIFWIAYVIYKVRESIKSIALPQISTKINKGGKNGSIDL